MEKEVIKKHPFAIRWFHWVNFPILAVMIWSGTLIYWANDVYGIRIGGREFIHFFPDNVWEALGMKFRLAEGMAFHFLFMWLFFINGLFYVIYTVFSGQWKYLLPKRGSFRDAWAVTLHDIGLNRKYKPDLSQYNGAQRFAYTAIIVMGLGSVITGLAIYKPTQLQWLCNLMGGYQGARAIHFILTIGFCLFFLVHVAQVIRAGWSNFKGIITGFEVKKDRGNKPTDLV